MKYVNRVVDQVRYAVQPHSVSVTLQIHILLRLHETSIVERHTSWLAGHPACDDTDMPTLKDLCGKLSEHAKSGPLASRISALQAIYTMSIEDPYIREALKECEKAHHFLRNLEEGSSKPRIRHWASRALFAVENEDVHRLWSDVITEPVSSDDMKLLSEGTVASDRRELAKLANSLRDLGPNSSYLANQYLELARKLAEDGPSEQSVKDIGHHIRLLLGHNKTLIAKGHRDAAGTDERAFNLKLGNLCWKLLQYVGHSYTAIAAMEEIIELTIEGLYIRDVLKECGETRRCLGEMKESSKPELHEWASIALDAVEIEGVHNLWSKVIKGDVSWSDMQQLLDGNVPRDCDKHTELAKSLSDPNSSYLANRYLERTMKHIVEEICLLLQHDKTTLFQRHAKHAAPAPADQSSKLQELCVKLSKYARYPYTATASMKEIISLTIEDPNVRKALKECKETHRCLSKMKESTEPLAEIQKWASTSLYAVENEEVHDLGSKVITGNASEHEMQHLFNKSVTNDSGELARTLSVSVNLSYLASRYLERVDFEKRAKGTAAAPGSFHPQTFSCKECDSGGSHPQETSQRKPKSSEELLKYVLESAPEGSLRDLSRIVPTSHTDEIAEGGFSEVHKGLIQIKGKDVNVAIKHLKSIESKQFVVKNFARELRVSARLTHPNVSTFLGYASREGQHYIVSEYTKKGSLRESRHNLTLAMTANQLFAMCLGIAKGVCYLHNKKIVHADIKAANVLVSPSGEPLLTDFGLSRMTETFWSKGFYTTEASRHSTRWLAYDYYHVGDSGKFRPNLKTDVWAFGMTLLELLTGKVPYEHIEDDGPVVTKVSNGVLPNKPTYEGSDPDAQLKDDIWLLCLKCWILVPKEHIENLSIQERLEKFSMSERPSMQDVVWELIRTKYRLGVGL